MFKTFKDNNNDEETQQQFTPSVNPSSEQTLIGASVKVEGDFHSQGDIVVHGVLSGSLKTQQSLEIGTSADITANIEAKDAVIAGKVTGDITVSEGLKLLSTAQINGNIKSQSISIQDGAKLSGHCEISPSGNAAPNSIQNDKQKKTSDNNKATE